MVAESTHRVPTRDGRPGTLVVAILAAVLCFGTVTSSFGGFGDMPMPQDEGILLVFPERVLHGAIPHRDFLTFYGPGDTWLLAALYRTFGTTLMTERLLGLAYRLAIVLGLFAALRRWGAWVAFAAASISILVLTDTYGYAASAWYGAMAITVWSVALLARSVEGPRGERAAVAAGLLAGLALVFRPDALGAVAVASLPGILLVDGRRRIRYAAGLVLGVIPLAVHLWISSPAAYLENVWIEGARHSWSGRRLPLTLENPWLVRRCALVGTAILVALVAGALGIRAERRSARAHALLALALFSAASIPYVLLRVDFVRLDSLGCLALPLLPVALASLIGRAPVRWAGRAAQPLAIVLTVLLSACGLQLVPYARTAIRRAHLGIRGPLRGDYVVARRGRSYPLERPEQVPDLQAVLADLDRWTRPGDTLFVGPRDLRRTNYNAVYLYYLMPELVPGSYFIQMDPGVANRQGSRLASDVAASRWLVLTRQYDAWNEPNDSRRYGSDAPLRVIASRFRLRARHGPFEIWERRTP